MNNKKLITIVGNVGTGKSTLTDLLADALPAIKVPADSLFKINPFFPLAVQDRARWSLTSDIWFLHERIKLSREIPDILAKANVIVDSGLPMSYAYAHSRIGSGYFTDDEWKLYEELYNQLITIEDQSDIVVYLHAPVPFLLERISLRGREFEVKYYKEEYLAGLQHSIELMIRRLKKKNVEVLSFDVSKVGFLNDVPKFNSLIEELVKI